MKKLVKLFIIAVLAVCGVSCELFGGLINGGNNNGETPHTANTAMIKSFTNFFIAFID